MPALVKSGKHPKGRINVSPNAGAKHSYQFRPLDQCSSRISFKVKAHNNAAICLSDGPRENPSAMVEILLAGWNGTRSVIRKNKTQELCSTMTPGLMDACHFKGFWITFRKNGIKVGREGEKEDQAFLNYNTGQSKLPLGFRITHYGYSTAYGTSGEWIFCDDAPNRKPQSGALHPPQHNQGLVWKKGQGSFDPGSGVPVSENGPYIATARVGTFLIPGTVTPGNEVCTSSWSGSSISSLEYYSLFNPGNLEIAWVQTTGEKLPAGAIQGGYADNKEPLYIGRVSVFGSYVCGKVQMSARVCVVPYNGKEHASSCFEVLCLKTVPFSLLGLNQHMTSK